MSTPYQAFPENILLKPKLMMLNPLGTANGIPPRATKGRISVPAVFFQVGKIVSSRCLFECPARANACNTALLRRHLNANFPVVAVLCS